MLASGAKLVLNFHGVGTPDRPLPAAEEPFWCDEGVFKGLLDSLGEISLRTGVPIDLTFDDGNSTDLTTVLPLLQERNLAASFFICAGRIGRPGYLDEPSIREIANSGMRVGSHGWDHVDWRCADEKTLERELVEAGLALAGITRTAVDSLAIPFGAYDRRVLARLKRHSFRQIFTSDGGRAPASGRVFAREAYQTWWRDDTLEHLCVCPPKWRTVAKGAVVRRYLK